MIIAVESEENVAEMFQVLRNAAIEGGEEFHRNQENVDHHGISNDDAKLVNGLAAGVGARPLSQNQAKENHKRRGRAANPEARNRGARTALIQKVRRGKPL